MAQYYYFKPGVDRLHHRGTGRELPDGVTFATHGKIRSLNSDKLPGIKKDTDGKHYNVVVISDKSNQQPVMISATEDWVCQ